MTEIKECHSPKLIPNANVTVAIKGLAVSNFNKNNGNWETVFLRHVEHHDLKITINKCRSGNLESSNSYTIEPNQKIYIRSDAEQAAQPVHYPEQSQKSLTHIIDFSAPEMYNGRIKLVKKPGALFTFLSISGSVVYTKKLSKNVYNIVKEQTIKQKKKIGLVIGADIIRQNGEQTEILVEGNPNMIAPLAAEENVVYEIIFDNDCYDPSRHPEGDFSRYYDLIDEAEKFTLRLDQSESVGELVSGGAESNEPLPIDPLPLDPVPQTDPPEKNPPCNATIISELEEGMDSLSELLNP